MKKTFLMKQQKNNNVTDQNIRKTTTGHGDNYATGCLLDYT